MPAWNASAFIEPVLASLAAQDYPNLEVLISVDQSPDATADVCERFAADHPNVRVIRQPARLGWLANANFTLREARGTYAFFAFHDDPLQPAYVTKLVAALEAHPDAILAFSDLLTSDGICRYTTLDDARTVFERCRRVFHAFDAWWVPNRGLMRLSAVQTLGGMRRHLGGEYCADWPWLLRLAGRGRFVRVDEPLLFKNFRERSLSQTWRSHPWNRLGVQLACMAALHEAGLAPLQELYLNLEALLYGLGLRRAPGWLKRIPRRLRARLAG
jgi:glycosyltransferase involved in cell wall biosynthesis